MNTDHKQNEFTSIERAQYMQALMGDLQLRKASYNLADICGDVQEDEKLILHNGVYGVCKIGNKYADGLMHIKPCFNKERLKIIYTGNSIDELIDFLVSHFPSHKIKDNYVIHKKTGYKVIVLHGLWADGYQGRMIAENIAKHINGVSSFTYIENPIKHCESYIVEPFDITSW